MKGLTRRSLVAAVGAGVASAGCLSDTGGTPDERTTDDRTPAASTTEPTTAGDATTGDWVAQASNSPEPDHAIRVENGLDEPRTLRVAVVREATGETVFETTRAVPPGERTLYNLREADPDGVERFRVCAGLVATTATGGRTTTASSTAEADSPRRDCVSIATNECYGNAFVSLSDDEPLRLIYAVC